MNRTAVVMTWSVWQASPQDEWRTWLTRHDLDPACIPMGASIAVTEPDHQIEVSHYLRPGELGYPNFADPRTVQCESAIMPWPQIGGFQSSDPFAVAPMTLGMES